MAVDITATKPAKQPGNPSWATNVSTRVEPTSGQKATGYTSGQRPTFSVLNWLIGFLADWTKYAEDATDQLDTKKLSAIGDNAMQADLMPDVNSTRSLGSIVKIWANAFIGEVFTNLVALSNVGDAKTTAYTRTLGSRMIPKAWGVLAPDGSGNVAVNDGCNVTSATISGNNIVVTLASAFTTTNYAILVTPWGGAPGDFTRATPITTSTFSISQLSHTDGTTAVSLNSATKPFSFVCFGMQ